MQDKAKQYSIIKHRLAIINIFLMPLLLWIFLMLGIPVYFKDAALFVSGNNYAGLIIFYALMGILYYAISLPLEFYSGFALEHRFSLSNQSLKNWAIREVRKISRLL